MVLVMGVSIVVMVVVFSSFMVLCVGGCSIV